MKYTIKYNGEYINEICGGYYENDDQEEFFQDYWLDTEAHSNYAMEFETLEEADSMLEEIHSKVQYVTWGELEVQLEIEEVV